MKKGVSLIELLIGAALFVIVLVVTARGINLAAGAFAAANQQLPVEMRLQASMDAATRKIRESVDVTQAGDPHFVILKRFSPEQYRPNTDGLGFNHGTLFFDSKPLQSDLDDVEFNMREDGFMKFVTITMTANAKKSDGTRYQKTLVSSVSLRTVIPMAVMRTRVITGIPGYTGAPDYSGRRPDLATDLRTTTDGNWATDLYYAWGLYSFDGYYGSQPVYLEPQHLRFIYRDAPVHAATLEVHMLPVSSIQNQEVIGAPFYVPVSALGSTYTAYWPGPKWTQFTDQWWWHSSSWTMPAFRP